MSIVARMQGWLWAAARVSVAALLLLATLLVFVNVVLRYVFNYSLSWSAELITYMLLWLVFLGSAIAARAGAHMSMEVVLTLLSARVQRLNAALVNTVCALLSAVVGILGWQLAVAVDQVGVATGLPMFWVYLAIPVGCLLMVLGFWEAALGRRGASAEAPRADRAASSKPSMAA